jgi:hypothetical protein
MKTFATSGIGNQQTLTGIETPTIFVYENESAIENDLSNLENDDWVSTPDTGDELSHPVDVVESGNLHAVTSNAVAESLSYSETEQATGGTWIDGKPIYKITKTGTGIFRNNTWTSIQFFNDNQQRHLIKSEGQIFSASSRVNYASKDFTNTVEYSVAEFSTDTNLSYYLTLYYTKG